MSLPNKDQIEVLVKALYPIPKGRTEPSKTLKRYTKLKDYLLEQQAMITDSNKAEIDTLIQSYLEAYKPKLLKGEGKKTDKKKKKKKVVEELDPLTKGIIEGNLENTMDEITKEIDDVDTLIADAAQAAVDAEQERLRELRRREPTEREADKPDAEKTWGLLTAPTFRSIMATKTPRLLRRQILKEWFERNGYLQFSDIDKTLVRQINTTPTPNLQDLLNKLDRLAAPAPIKEEVKQIETKIQERTAKPKRKPRSRQTKSQQVRIINDDKKLKSHR